MATRWNPRYAYGCKACGKKGYQTGKGRYNRCPRCKRLGCLTWVKLWQGWYY